MLSWMLLLTAGAASAGLAILIGSLIRVFSQAPRLQCGCLADWMVQPIMASLLGLGFPIRAANDPADPTAFAAGPFMLFRRATCWASIAM